MDYRILGPLEVLDEGREIPVQGSKQRALLGLLLLHGNETMSTARVIDELWGDQPPATATKTVHVHVSRLRKALAAPGNGVPGALLTREHGYELRVEPDALDADRFESLAEHGNRELAAGHPGEAVAALEAALGLWRGPPLSDLAGEPFAQPEIARLEELRMVAVERLCEAVLALGEHDVVVSRLGGLIREHPYRERLRALLMLALYRADRQAEALQAYTNARRRLVGDLGIEPGEHLRELERQILAQDPGLALPPPETLELPSELESDTPLVGREEDLAWLREHWRRTRAGAGRTVVITGPRGIGKTRLAGELARGVLRERLRVLYATGLDPSALAGALGATRPTLLVLDDVCEPPRNLDRLASSPVLVLATAEDPAALRGAATRRLAPLCADDVLAIARHYAPRSEIPVELLLEATGGLPAAVHSTAAEWARAEAEKRLGGAAGRAAAGRSGLRVAEDDLTGSVVELQALRERALPRADVVACPFKGLSPFDVEDAGLFFGRERLVAEMVARLPGTPLMGIVGPSGSGKSSALRAGLLAALRTGVLPGSESWAISVLRPGEHPLRVLRARGATRGREVIAVDQFEEIFTACSDEAERTAFVDALLAAARDPDRRALVLIAVRADFYGRCAVYAELARLLGANHVLVGPMRRDELRRAIELPARRAGLHVETELGDALVAEVEREPGGLPLLSSALVELWQHRDGRALRLSAYERTGGVHGAVARLAERAYARLDAPQREIARRILLRLAGEGEGTTVVRRRAGIDELEADRDPIVARVLSVLADERLVTVGDSEAEVAHEALLREWPRLRGWLEEDAQARRLHVHLRAAARDWDAGGRDAGELYRGARLASALEWAGTHEADLNATEREFLAEGSATANRSQRRLRAVLAGVSALLVVAVVAGAMALHQQGNARREATAAEAQRLGARALLDDQLDRALLLARQGVALDDTPRTRGNLLGTLLHSPALTGVIRAGDATVESAAVDPRGRLLAVGDNAGQVQLFDARSRKRLRTLKPTANASAITGLAFNPDGAVLAALHTSLPGTTAEFPPGWRHIVTLLDARTGGVVRRIELPRDEPASGARFSHDGRTLEVSTYTGDTTGRLLRFDPRTGRRRAAPVPYEHGGRLTSDPFQLWPRSPALTTDDGRRIVAIGLDGATVRDSATLAVLRRFPQASREAIGTLATAFALTGDGRTAAIGGDNGIVHLLDLDDGTLRAVAGRHRGPVNDVAFDPAGRRLVSTSEDGRSIVWDTRSATQVEVLNGHTSSAFSPSFAGDTLYTASLDGTVLVWEMADARRLGRRFDAGTIGEGSPRYALSSDGRLLAHGRGDGTVNLIDMRTLRRRASVPVVDETGVAGPGDVEGIRFVPGTHLLVVGSNYGGVALVDADRAAVVRRLRGHAKSYRTPSGDLTDNPIKTPGVSADGRLLATTSGDGMVNLWSLPDGRRLGAPIEFRTNGASDGQLSPDGRWLSVQALNERVFQDRIEIWDVRARRRARSLWLPGGVSYSRFSPDGRLLAIGDLQRRVHLYSTKTWKPATDVVLNADAVWAAFSPDSAVLAAGGLDGTVRLFDVANGQALGALPSASGSTAVPMFLPGDAGLVAGQDDGTATLWDLRPAALARRACEIAGRRLTHAEWDAALPGRAYAPAC